ncbi:MAG TPA: hypothetical protein PLE45_07800 [Spirochaetota bacterium]|nr:hypothetical protein [Spirochaetota bacterium]HOL58189.1 hypothetical protein [Spirochaetota bacterium]
MVLNFPKYEEPAWLYPQNDKFTFNLLDVIKDSLLYPAGRFDGFPIPIFLGNVYSFIYIDYTVERDSLFEEFLSPQDPKKGIRGYTIIFRKNISIEDLPPFGDWYNNLPDYIKYSYEIQNKYYYTQNRYHDTQNRYYDIQNRYHRKYEEKDPKNIERYQIFSDYLEYYWRYQDYNFDDTNRWKWYFYVYPYDLWDLYPDKKLEQYERCFSSKRHYERDPLSFCSKCGPPYCEWFIFERLPQLSDQYGPKRFSFLFFNVEAISTYQNIFLSNNLSPPILFMENPGNSFGCGWTPSYENLMKNTIFFYNKKLAPKYIYDGSKVEFFGNVGDNDKIKYNRPVYCYVKENNRVVSKIKYIKKQYNYIKTHYDRLTYRVWNSLGAITIFEKAE